MGGGRLREVVAKGGSTVDQSSVQLGEDKSSEILTADQISFRD